MQNTADEKMNKKSFKNSLEKKGNIWRNKMSLVLGREWVWCVTEGSGGRRQLTQGGGGERTPGRLGGGAWG